MWNKTLDFLDWFGMTLIAYIRKGWHWLGKALRLLPSPLCWLALGAGLMFMLCKVNINVSHKHQDATEVLPDGHAQHIKTTSWSGSWEPVIPPPPPVDLFGGNTEGLK